MSMAVTDNPLITGLMKPGAYPHPCAAIELIETHISWVLLTGDFAYKIKKPVDFGFLDFSTLKKRQVFCQEELRLNRRFTNELYLEVVPITGTPAQPAIGDPEIRSKELIIEYAVKMRQFEAGCLLSERAEQDLLSFDDIDAFAEIISRFHQSAKKAETVMPYGEANEIRHWSEENFEHIETKLDDALQLLRLHKIKNWTRDEWRLKARLMHQRKQQGFVRECHGDLHLGNIALIDGEVTPFDCIEFNPKLRWIDVMSELAFILMDLAHRNLDAFFWRLLNGYLRQTGDYGGLPLLRYYLVYRAMVRAKVALLSLHPDADASESERIHKAYIAYTRLAERYIKMTQPMLLITHGYSGSGKSFVSSWLAENDGTIHLRSDIERKRLFGYKAHDDTVSAVGNGIYTAEASRKTYRYLADLADTILNAGFDVIVDAAFLKQEQRALFQQLAEKLNVPLLILDFQADESTLQERIQLRQQQQNDPSEATIEVLQQQITTAEPLTEAERNMTIEIDGTQPDAPIIGVRVKTLK